jgi:hypothetical protein
MWTALIEIGFRSKTRPGKRIVLSLLVGFIGPLGAIVAYVNPIVALIASFVVIGSVASIVMARRQISNQ